MNTCSFIVLLFHPDKKQLSRLKQSFAKVTTLFVDNSDINKGYAGGMNQGVSEAMSKNSSWVVLVNQDIRISQSEVVRFSSLLKSITPGIVGPNSGGLDPVRWTSILTNKQCEYISGSWMAIHRDVIKKIGLLSEPYFLYYEDVEYCIRAKKARFPISTIRLSLSHEKEITKFEHYYLARNHLLFVERNAPWSVKLHELFRLPKTMWEHYSRGEYLALRGIFDFLICRFGPYRRGLW